MRIHILSCSARKQRAEECQILQPGIKYPCCALWGSCPCTHSLLDTLGHIWSQPGQQAHQLPQEAFWPAPLSRSMASFGSRHIFCEPGPATHSSLGTSADGCPSSQDSQPESQCMPSICFTPETASPQRRAQPSRSFLFTLNPLDLVV